MVNKFRLWNSTEIVEINCDNICENVKKICNIDNHLYFLTSKNQLYHGLLENNEINLYLYQDIQAIDIDCCCKYVYIVEEETGFVFRYSENLELINEIELLEESRICIHGNSIKCKMKVKMIASGEFGILFVTEMGQLWASGQMNQIGVTNSDYPKKVLLFDGKIVHSVGVGLDFAVVIVSKQLDCGEDTDDELCISNCHKCRSMSQLNSPISNQDKAYDDTETSTTSTSDTVSNSSNEFKKSEKNTTDGKTEKNIIFRNTEAAKEFLTRQFSWMSAGEEYLVECTEKPKRIIKENVTNMASLVYEGVRTVGDKVVTLSKHVNGSFENNDDSVELIEGAQLPRITSNDEFNWSLSQASSDKDLSEQQSSMETRHFILKRGSSLINCEVWTWGNIMHGQLGLGDNVKRDRPMIITKLTNMGAYKISVQYLHCGLLTLDGRVFLWGKNCFNQVTTDNNNDQSSPKQFICDDNNKRMLDVACNIHNSGVLTTDLNFYYIGKNVDGMLTIYENHNYKENLVDDNRKVNFLLATNTFTLFNNKYILNTCIIDYLVLEQRNLENMLVINANILKPIQKINQNMALFETLCRNYTDLMYFNAVNVETLILYFKNKLSSYCDILMFKQIDDFLYFYKCYLNTLFDVISISGCDLINQSIDIVPLVYKQLNITKDKNSDQNIVYEALMKPFYKMTDYREMISEVIEKNGISSVDEKTLKDVRSKWQLFIDEQEQKQIDAKNTNTFWLSSGKLIKHLKVPKRRLIRDSHKNPIYLFNASRFSSHWFILFNDLFVHINGSSVCLHDLKTVWVEPQQEEEETTSNQYQILLKMPEDNLTLYTQSPNEKMEWLHDFQITINSILGKINSQLLPPINRSSSYTFKSRNSTLKDAKFTGRWSRAKMHGLGKMEWIDGKLYTGQFCNNLFHGFGRMEMPNTGIYEGQWKDNLQNGFGILKYVNGDIYKGFFKDGLPHGHGLLKQGRFMSSAAFIYIGDFSLGNKNGYGVMDDIAAGEKYLGNWSDNKKHGNGILVNSDGIYYEGTFNQDTLMGHGLMILEDGTHYEGEFKGTGILSGKGTLTLKSGHTIEGSMLGSLNEEIKISNGILSIPKGNTDLIMSKNFGTTCTPVNSKWRALFRNCYQILGAAEKQIVKGIDNQKIWDHVAVIISNTRHSDSQKKKIDRTIENSLKHLDTIPQFCRDSINTAEYKELKTYLQKAFDCPYHPLGSLLSDLTLAYTTTYGGPSAHPLLLTHAVNELHSITRRLYDIVRLLFPALPSFEEERKVPEEEDASDIICCENLLYPIILPRVHSSLFILYTLRNKQQEFQYWKRLLEWNKHSDYTLMAFLSVDPKFLKTELPIPSPSKDDPKKDETFVEAVESLQQLKTTFSPLEKLMVIRQTFQKISVVAQERLGVDYRWNMDDLFPVFLYIVVRARIPELGSELNFITDFMEPNLENGELGIMFTTLKACYHQILQEKVSIM